MGQGGITTREGLVALIQRLNRRMNTSYLETVHQGNFFELARRTEWLTETPLASPSGGTASFALLYALLAVLGKGGVKRILELGSGQSSTLFDQYIARFGGEVVHVDDNQEWLERATSTSIEGVTQLYAPLTPTRVSGHNIDWYNCTQPPGLFDLVLVDGPEAWTAASRFNRLGILQWVPELLSLETVLLVDDTNRRAEKRLVTEILARLRGAGLEAQAREIVGANSATIIATAHYQHLLYL